MRHASIHATSWALTLFSVVLVSAPSPARGQTQVHAGISIGDEGLRNFYLAIGDYYRVPEREVIVVRQREIPDDELPVVFFLASRAQVEPGVIVEMRLGGMSWNDVTLHLGLGPDIFYYPVRIAPGPPYGQAYGCYRKYPRRDWRRVRLEDDDIVNLVNLRFVSEHEHMAPTRVMVLRGGGRSFTTICHEAGREKSHGREEGDRGRGKSEGRGHHGRERD